MEKSGLNVACLRSGLDDTYSPEVAFDDQVLIAFADSRKIQSMMEDITKLTQITLEIVDLKGNTLVSTGRQELCDKFHRAHPVTARNCTEKEKIFLPVGPSNFPLDGSVPDPKNFSAGEIKEVASRGLQGRTPKRIVLRLPIKDTPFSMMIVGDSAALLGKWAPDQLLFRMGIVTIIILCGAFFVFFLILKFLVVRARLEESMVREQQIKERDAALRKARDELEFRVIERTMDLD